MMQGRPFEHHRADPRGSRPPKNPDRRNTHENLIIAIEGMKVRRGVVIEEHLDLDPEKYRNRWHLASKIAPLRIYLP